MIDIKYKKALTQFEGKSFYLFLCIPFLCIVFGISYLIAAVRIAGLIDLNFFEIINVWTASPEYNKEYPGILIKALGCLNLAFLQFDWQ
jgi:hypothetical protein